MNRVLRNRQTAGIFLPWCVILAGLHLICPESCTLVCSMSYWTHTWRARTSSKKMLTKVSIRRPKATWLKLAKECVSICSPKLALFEDGQPRLRSQLKLHRTSTDQNGHFVSFRSFARFFADLSASPLKSLSCRTERRERLLSSVERGHAFPVPTATRAPGSVRVSPQVQTLAERRPPRSFALLCCCCCRYSARSWASFFFLLTFHL